MSSSNNLLDQAADRVFCVAGAFVFSQFPRFMGQYMELLSKIISGKETIKPQAGPSGTSLINSIITLFKDLGIDISLKRNFASNVERITFYRDALTQWKEVSELEKPFVFLSHIDFQVVKILDYSAVFQKDTKSLVYAFAGIFAGAIAYKLFIKTPYYLFFAKERKKINRRNGGGMQ